MPATATATPATVMPAMATAAKAKATAMPAGTVSPGTVPAGASSEAFREGFSAAAEGFREHPRISEGFRPEVAEVAFPPGFPEVPEVALFQEWLVRKYGVDR